MVRITDKVNMQAEIQQPGQAFMKSISTPKNIVTIMDMIVFLSVNWVHVSSLEVRDFVIVLTHEVLPFLISLEPLPWTDSPQ